MVGRPLTFLRNTDPDTGPAAGGGLGETDVLAPSCGQTRDGTYFHTALKVISNLLPTLTDSKTISIDE